MMQLIVASSEKLLRQTMTQPRPLRAGIVGSLRRRGMQGHPLHSNIRSGADPPDWLRDEALLGRFGSDGFRHAVPADGSTFFGGLIVDKTTGTVDQPRLPRVSPAEISRDHVRSGGSMFGSDVSTAPTESSAGRLTIGTVSARARIGTITSASAGAGTDNASGIQRAASARAVADTPPAVMIPIARYLSFMSPPRFLLPAPVGSWAPRTLSARDSRSW